MMSKFYNLYIPVTEGKTCSYLNEFIELGYSGFAIVSYTSQPSNTHGWTDTLRYCRERNIECYPRLHITYRYLNKLEEKDKKKIIFGLRSKFSKKGYIISIEDSLLSFLTPNEALKFDIITVTSPSFRKIIKLINKPILFEYIPSKKSLSDSWLKRRLFILKLLLDKDSLFISQDPTMHPIIPPSQLSLFLYGLLGYTNMSYNIVSTLPLKVISRCR